VTFAGLVARRGQEPHVWAAAGVCVLPSLHENFGIAALAAVARGGDPSWTPGVQLAPVDRGAREVGLVTERFGRRGRGSGELPAHL